MVVSPTTKLVVELIFAVLTGFWLCFCFSAMWIDIQRITIKPRSRVANLIWYWSKWPALVLAVGSPVFEFLRGTLDLWDGALCAWYVYVWWINRDKGDDDDYKKLKKKLKEKVTEMRGKLVIVPEPA